MLSSWQVSAMHAQQGQQFASQQQYSHTLSSQMPSPYGGFAGPGPLSSSPFGMAYGSGPGPGYNYGGGAATQAPAFGNWATSVVGGMGGSASRSMPILGAIGGMRMGGMVGGMVGGALGMGASAVGQHVFGSMMEGAYEQQQLERTLGQFQFGNAASRTGKGFSRQDSMAIGNMVRQMERMPEMLTSFGELNRLMDKMGQMGLMQGVRDAGDFMSKFKTTVGTIKDMAKMMGTTMEGALQAFGESRMSGFYSKQDILRNTLNRQVTGSLTGMNQEQIAQLQQFGGEMGHARGGSRRSGAQYITRTAQQLGMAQQMGILTKEQVLEMTGKEGAAGIQDLSVQMNDLGYRMGRSNVGQALTLALGKTEDGKYTGEIDQELAARVRSGQVGLSELKQLARSKARGRNAKLSFAAHKERLRSEMVGAVGAEGVAMQLQSILGDRGWNNPDATSLVMQRFGASEEQANLLQKLMPNMENIGLQMGMQRKQESRNMARNTVLKEQYSFEAMKKKLSTQIKHVTTDWAKDIGKDVRDYFTGWFDDFVDELTGTYRTEVTKRSVDLFKRSMSGDKGARSYTDRLTQAGERSGAARGLSAKTRSGSVSADIFGAGGGTALDGTVSQQELIQLSKLAGGMFVNTRTEKNDFNAWTQGRAGEQSMSAGSAQIQGAVNYRMALAGDEGDKLNQRLKANPESYKVLADRMGDALRSNAVLNAANDSERLAIVEKQMQQTAPKIFDAAKKQLGSGEEVILALMKDKRFDDVRTRIDAKEIAKRTGQAKKGADMRSLGKEIDAAGKTLAKSLTGADDTFSFDELNKEISGNTAMGRLLMGNPGRKDGLLYRRGAKEVKDILVKTKFSAEDKATLESMGLSKSEVNALELDQGAREKMQRTLNVLDEKAGDEGGLGLEKYVSLKDQMGNTALREDFQKRGLQISQQTDRGGVNKTLLSDLSKKTKGKSEGIMSLLSMTGDLYSRKEFNAGLRHSRAVSEAYANLDPKDREEVKKALLAMGADEVVQGGEYSVQLARKKKSLESSRTGKMNLSDLPGAQNLSDSARKQIEGITGADGTITKANFDKVSGIAKTDFNTGLVAKAKKESDSSQASEKEIADTLLKMSENTKNTAELIKALRDNPQAPPK